MSTIAAELGLFLSNNRFYITLIFITTLVSAIFRKIKANYARNPKGLPTPPGPKGLPFVGKLLDMPTDRPWIKFNEWGKVFGTGDMVYFEVLGQPYLVLNSLKGVTDLLEKRSSNYSDRPRLPMLNELMGWSCFFGFIPYGSRWRRHRRIFHEHFHQNTVHRYQPIIGREVGAFLQRLLDTPENFMHHIRHTFAATIMDISYGIRVQQTDDPYISRAETSLQGLAIAGIFGTFLVDLIPVLKYVPAWFYGASFRRKAEHWRKINQEVAEIPFKYVEDHVGTESTKPCISVSLIDNLPEKVDPTFEESRTIAKQVVAVSYLGGADTTVSSVQTFFLAMALHPEVQKKAQAELDKVVGPNRLPDSLHRPDLVYINAIVKEVTRWNIVAPLAVGHMSTADDEYNGYFIPGGTIVMGNSWAILHDPNIFSEPEKFIPERFIKDGKIDPSIIDPNVAAFGFGRRICPGRHLSDIALYTTVSSLLAAYDIKAYHDKTGKVNLQPQFTSGMLTYPVPFKCEITPRSLATKKMIQGCTATFD